MRFLIDQNLPASLADWIVAQGHDAEHVRLLGLEEADDRTILAAARERSAVLVSKDADFARDAGDPPIAIVWIRIGNTTNPRLKRLWDAIWPGILEALEAGETLVEVGRKA